MGFPNSPKVLPKTSAGAISHSGRVVTQRGSRTVFRYFLLRSQPTCLTSLTPKFN
jgi:hypothetical protein